MPPVLRSRKRKASPSGSGDEPASPPGPTAPGPSKAGPSRATKGDMGPPALPYLCSVSLLNFDGDPGHLPDEFIVRVIDRPDRPLSHESLRAPPPLQVINATLNPSPFPGYKGALCVNDLLSNYRFPDTTLGWESTAQTFASTPDVEGDYGLIVKYSVQSKSKSSKNPAPEMRERFGDIFPDGVWITSGRLMKPLCSRLKANLSPLAARDVRYMEKDNVQKKLLEIITHCQSAQRALQNCYPLMEMDREEQCLGASRPVLHEIANNILNFKEMFKPTAGQPLVYQLWGDASPDNTGYISDMVTFSASVEFQNQVHGVTSLSSSRTGSSRKAGMPSPPPDRWQGGFMEAKRPRVLASKDMELFHKNLKDLEDDDWTVHLITRAFTTKDSAGNPTMSYKPLLVKRRLKMFSKTVSEEHMDGYDHMAIILLQFFLEFHTSKLCYGILWNFETSMLGHLERTDVLALDEPFGREGKGDITILKLLVALASTTYLVPSPEGLFKGPLKPMKISKRERENKKEEASGLVEGEQSGSGYQGRTYPADSPDEVVSDIEIAKSAERTEDIGVGSYLAMDWQTHHSEDLPSATFDFGSKFEDVHLDIEDGPVIIQGDVTSPPNFLPDSDPSSEDHRRDSDPFPEALFLDDDTCPAGLTQIPPSVTVESLHGLEKSRVSLKVEKLAGAGRIWEAYSGTLGKTPVVVKVVNERTFDTACRRFPVESYGRTFEMTMDGAKHELEFYTGILRPYQGSVIPRLYGYHVGEDYAVMVMEKLDHVIHCGRLYKDGKWDTEPRANATWKALTGEERRCIGNLYRKLYEVGVLHGEVLDRHIMRVPGASIDADIHSTGPFRLIDFDVAQEVDVDDNDINLEAMDVFDLIHVNVRS